MSTMPSGYHRVYQLLSAHDPDVEKAVSASYNIHNDLVHSCRGNPEKITKYIELTKFFNFILLLSSIAGTVDVLHSAFLDTEGNTMSTIAHWGNQLNSPL